MGLQAQVISAVSKVKSALGDLAVDMTLRTRVQNTYVPGSSISYTDSDVAVKGVITKFRDDEVDGTMIEKKDVLLIMFPPTNKAIPKPNDVVIHGINSYRVVSNNPMYAGSEIAFNLVQLRPPI